MEAKQAFQALTEGRGGTSTKQARLPPHSASRTCITEVDWVTLYESPADSKPVVRRRSRGRLNLVRGPLCRIGHSLAAMALTGGIPSGPPAAAAAAGRGPAAGTGRRARSSSTASPSSSGAFRAQPGCCDRLGLQ